MKRLMIGVSLATLTIATPAMAGRYIVYECTPNQNRENWFLIFDSYASIANFSKAGEDKPRYGIYLTNDNVSTTTVFNDTAATMDLELRPNHNPTGKPVLEWTSGTIHSTMLCDYLYEKDATPVNWTIPHSTAHDVPLPLVTDNGTIPGSLCTGSDSIPHLCHTTQYIPPSATAYVPQTMPAPLAETLPQLQPPPAPAPMPLPSEAPAPSTGIVVALTESINGSHTVDVLLGDMTVTMTIDTGASIVSLPGSIAYPLLKSGGASITGMTKTKIADGSIVTEPEININKLTIGGRVLYNIEAVITSDNAMTLLGTNVLNQFGKYTVDTKNNQLILG
jgi:clan AA aspartic protease (TIGR02281 family)